MCIRDRRVYCLSSLRGNEPLLSLAVFEPNDEPLWLISEPGVLGGYTFDSERRCIAYLWSTTDDPAQLLVRDIGEDGTAGEPRSLTSLNSWLAEMATGDIEDCLLYTSPAALRAATAMG